MKFDDPFPSDMTAATFVEALHKMIQRPYITAEKMVDEKERLAIAMQEGQCELADRLLAWARRKNE